MRVTPEERDSIVERLAEIREDLQRVPEDLGHVVAAEEKLDRETTQLLSELADENPAKPVD